MSTLADTAKTLERLRASRLLRVGLFAVVALPLVQWQMNLFWFHTIDDAAISFSYLQSWLGGGGLAIRPGEPPVEALSNMLMILVMAPFAALGSDYFVIAKWIGAASMLATAALIYRLVLRMNRDLVVAGLVPVAFLLAAPLYGFWVFSGLEVGLFGLCVTGVFYRALVDGSERGTRWSRAIGPVLQTATVMCRPDGALYVLAAQAWVLGSVWWWRRSTDDETDRPGLPDWLYGAGLAMACYGVYALVHFATFRAVLPNSFKAKGPATVGGVDLFAFDEHGWAYVRGCWTTYRLGLLMTVAALGGLVRSSTRGPALLALAFLAAGHFFCVYAGGDWMLEWRFVALMWPAFALVVALGAAGLAGAATDWVIVRKPRPVLRFVSYSLLGAALLFGLTSRVWATWGEQAHARTGNYHTTFDEIRTRSDMWMEVAEHSGLLRPRIGDVDAGGITFDRDIGYLDMGKLADLTIPWHHPYTMGHLREYIFYEDRPDMLHLHGGWSNAYRLHELDEWDALYAPLDPELATRLGATGENQVRLSTYTVDSVPVGEPAGDGPALLWHTPSWTEEGDLAVVSVAAASPAALVESLRFEPCEGGRGTDVPVIWAGGVIDAQRALRRGWVTGAARHPVLRDLLSLGCGRWLAADGTELGRVVEADSPTGPAVTSANAYLTALSSQPSILLWRNQSPLQPATMRALCPPDETLDDPCFAPRQVVRQLTLEPIVNTGVGRAERLLDGGHLDAAAHWLVATREAAGMPAHTDMPQAWRDLAEDTAADLFDQGQAALASNSDDLWAANRVRLSIRLNPTAIGPRRFTERHRFEWSPPVPGIERTIRAQLRGRLADPARASTHADDARALVASFVRSGQPRAALECLTIGPCAPHREAPLVSPWATWLDAFLLTGGGGPPPNVGRTSWDFEGDLPGELAMTGTGFAIRRANPGPVADFGTSGYRGYGFLAGERGDGTSEAVVPVPDGADFLGMLIAGSQAEVLCEDERVHTVRGARRTHLNPRVVDLRPYRGRSCLLRLTTGSSLLVDAISWIQ